MKPAKQLIPNPYTNRAGITSSLHFVGREAQLRDIFTRIQGGQSVLLMGERRIGKSSLLHAVGFERGEWLDFKTDFVMVDLQSLAGCNEDAFIRAFLQAIETVTGAKAPDVSRAALEWVAEAIHSSGSRLIVAMDEFDVLVWNEKIPPEFLANLRSWTVRHEFPLVVAFREGSIDRIVEDPKFGSAFLNLFGSVYVGPFDENDAQELAWRPAHDRAIEFSDDEVDLVLDLAGFFPLFIQIACYHLFELKKVAEPPANLEALVERQFRFEAAPHMEYMWHRLDDREKQALHDWISVGGTNDDDAQEELLRKGLLIEERRALRLYSRLLPALIRKWQAAPQRSIAQSVRDALLR
jgi:hypothetical protein